MRLSLLALLVVSVAIGVFVAQPGMAKNGAVKFDILRKHDVVGFAVANYTSSGMVQIQIQLKDAEPDTAFEGTVYSKPLFLEDFELTTNKTGKAHIHIAADPGIPPDAIVGGKMFVVVTLHSDSVYYRGKAWVPVH